MKLDSYAARQTAREHVRRAPRTPGSGHFGGAPFTYLLIGFGGRQQEAGDVVPELPWLLWLLRLMRGGVLNRRADRTVQQASKEVDHAPPQNLGSLISSINRGEVDEH
jgi:hypothetical protein